MQDLTSCALKMPPGLSAIPVNAHWQPKLESAQNVLFCKELFHQVCVCVTLFFFFFFVNKDQSFNYEIGLHEISLM
jgi:hypothetical protein